MALPTKLAMSRPFRSIPPRTRFLYLSRPPQWQARRYLQTQETSTGQAPPQPFPTAPSRNPSTATSSKSEFTSSTSPQDSTKSSMPAGWEDEPNFNIEEFSQLPHEDFGKNQWMHINEEFRKTLQQIVSTFRAPVRYAFAYGSGVFPQSGSDVSRSSLSPHPHPPDAIVQWQKGGGKIIDFIFGVTFTQHWHSLNLRDNRNHYSFLGSLGSSAVSHVQDSYGAGVYFNPYITVNGTMIKYGVVNLETLRRDLSEWDTLYLAGRLQKPVKILREVPQIRLANQVNLISAVRCALLMLGPSFTEKELYTAIAGLSYMGDPRMSMNAENPQKVSNIVSHQLPYFRRLYHPFIEDLPNLSYNDSRIKTSGNFEGDTVGDFKISQDMDPVKRGNMVRRLPKAFRGKLYFAYQKKFEIPQLEFQKMMDEATDDDEGSFKKRLGGPFERRIAQEDDLKQKVADCIRQTVRWPSTSQSIKSFLTAGPVRSWHYMKAKAEKNREGKSARAAKET